MDWYTVIFELIDMRSFSNLWFWIALAVLWSSASHWVLGVPWDMVNRSKRQGGEAEAHLDTLVHIYADRILFIVAEAGLWITGFGFFITTTLAMMGFVYHMEFAQAVFLLFFPMLGVAVISMNTARAVKGRDLHGEALRNRLKWHRLYVQLVGMVSIFVTAMWGMFINLSTSPLMN